MQVYSSQRLFDWKESHENVTFMMDFPGNGSKPQLFLLRIAKA